MPNSLIAPLITVIGLAATLNVQAVTIFNDFGPGDSFQNSGLLLQGPDVHTIGDVDQAAAFTLGGTGYRAISVKLGIFVDSSPSPGTGHLDISIFSDSAGVPGAALGTFTRNLTTTGDQLVTGAYSSLILDANTKYWLVVDTKDTFDGAWEFNNQGVHGTMAGRSNGGLWAVDNAYPQDFFAFSVEGREAVPEPGTLACTGVMALVALVYLRRRTTA